jgi:hemerythrin superfamily protein
MDIDSCGNKGTMDLLDQLTKEHREAERLLDKLAGSDEGPERDETIAQLVTALTKHMDVEETRVYPIVRERIGTEENEEAQTEHNLAREGLQKLQELAKAPGFGAAVDMVKGGISHHVKDEEKEMFPKLRKEATADELALQPADIDLEAASRDELYELASAAGIEGRSSMSKDQLKRALAGSS